MANRELTKPIWKMLSESVKLAPESDAKFALMKPRSCARNALAGTAEACAGAGWACGDGEAAGFGGGRRH